jgi:hypothetical protein
LTEPPAAPVAELELDTLLAASAVTLAALVVVMVLVACKFIAPPLASWVEVVVVAVLVFGAIVKLIAAWLAPETWPAAILIMVVVPFALAVVALAIALLITLEAELAAKFTTVVFALAAVAALVALLILVVAALAAVITAAATPPTVVGVDEVLDFLLLDEVLELEEVLELPEEELLDPVPDPEPDPEPELVEPEEELEVELELDDPLALTGPANTIPLASMVTPPELPPAELTEPLTLIAWAVAVI